jgi:hypothetical protein
LDALDDGVGAKRQARFRIRQEAIGSESFEVFEWFIDFFRQSTSSSLAQTTKNGLVAE